MAQSWGLTLFFTFLCCLILLILNTSSLVKQKYSGINQLKEQWVMWQLV